MSYFNGKNLERKIKEFALEELDEILKQLVNEEGQWPGDLAVPAEADILEATRVVLYSMLHKYGLKDEFRVKMFSDKKVIVVGLKAGSGSCSVRRKGNIQKWGSEASFFTLSSEALEKKDNLDQMLQDESTSLAD